MPLGLDYGPVMASLHVWGHLEACLQLNELQPVARAAAKVAITGPGINGTELIFAHSLKKSLPRPWDHLDVTLSAPQGTMLWSLAEPCMPALQQVESPRITGNLGPRLGFHFRFAEPGVATLLRAACCCLVAHTAA